MIALICIAVLVGIVGVVMIYQSSATSKHLSGPIKNKQDCNLLGRVWKKKTKTCENKCSDTSHGNYLVTNQAYNYCKGNISFISQNQCEKLSRRWAKYAGGCSRRNDRKDAYDQLRCTPTGRYISITTSRQQDYCYW